MTCSRVPIGALYIDEARDYTEGGTGIKLLNTIPEDGEDGVPSDGLIRLHIASLDNVALNMVTLVHVTRSSTGIRELAYDQAGGGFQVGYNGAGSSAVFQASPGSAVNDELLLTIDCTSAFTSLESVLIEVTASSPMAVL